MLGLYFHIPYCLQRCRYCDFATYVFDEILPPEEYISLVQAEIQQKQNWFQQKKIHSIYFGGGTPSLLDADLIITLLEEIAKYDAVISPDTEITLEINPATLNPKKIERLLKGGINRFSVGAQTFHDHHLKAAGRKHSSAETRQTLDLLKSFGINYSFDLLFALPQQTLEELKQDLAIIAEYSPPHLSAYCLTVPEGHPMSYNRPNEDHQITMFQMIESDLSAMGLLRYEISNFAKPSFESKHNLLYWQDQDFLGFGLSAHSYLKSFSPWGNRFGNPSSIEKYKQMILQPASQFIDKLQKEKTWETLSLAAALFDFAHTSLRLEIGLDENSLHQKFSPLVTLPLRQELARLLREGLLHQPRLHCWTLTEKGRHLSNYVFSCLHAQIPELTSS